MSVLNLCKNKRCYLVIDADLDGNGSSLLSDFFIKPIASYYYRYNTGDRKLPDFNWDIVEQSDIVIFIDIAPYSLEMVNRIKKTSLCLIIDHHESSKKELGELENYIYSTEKCATKIFFEEIIKERRVSNCLSKFVDLVNCYDTYDTENILWRNAKALNNILYKYVDWKVANFQNDSEKHQKFINNQLQKIDKDKDFYFTAWEKQKALDAEKQEKKNYQDAKKSLQIRKDNDNNVYGYFECSSKVSWVSHLLLKEYKNIKYLIGHSTFLENYRKQENGKLSLRSRKNEFDVSIIAQKWKNGGHKEASGMELSLEDFYKLKKGELHLI